MTAPKRIQLRRTKGWRKPEGTVNVARPTKWGNPFTIGGSSGLARTPAIHHRGKPWEYEGRISAEGMRHDYHHGNGRVTEVHVRAMTRAEVVECYRAWVTGGGWPIDWRPQTAPTVAEIRARLAGRDLACWCPLDQPCHADVLLEIANGGAS
ncbi:DUF4326 domain-containing protein [Isoptericola aurantiacus]|uniref:DUF4326 domain-containing protein n=1 Tax=Isoptericola aurantiacus TaxID=3377839 RepID=UPI00383A5592